MDQKFLKISNLFNEKKYDELIFFIQSSFQDKSAQILNILGVSRLFNSRDPKSLILAISDFKQGYLKEKKTQFGLEALINFINTAVDLYTLQSPAEDFKHDSSIYLNQTNFFYDEAKIHFGYNQKLVSAMVKVYKNQGDITKTLHHYKMLFDNNNLNLSMFSSWIFFNNYKDEWAQKDYLKYSKLFEKYIEKIPENKLIKINKIKNDKIKIGFLSADILKKHSITYFLKTILKNYDKDKFEIYLYLDNNIEDENTNELKILVEKTFNISKLNNPQVLNLIRKDKIDVMFDIAGLTSIERIALFKNRLAAKQISWLGYCNTTGLKNVDYLIADKNLIYPDEEDGYSEKIIYLSNIWNCHSGLDFSIVQTEAPCLKEKNITFASFNNFNKINDNVINVWSKILQNVKNSKLILKSSLKIDSNFLKTKFADKGVLNSVIFLEKRKLDIHFNLYKQVDIALDTFPYNGVTTSFEAISMGVPVITMKGFNFNSRCGASINMNLGMENLIAKDEEDYIFKAKELAEDKEKLSNIRKKIFKNSCDTPLFDTKKFSKDFFNILENI